MELNADEYNDFETTAHEIIYEELVNHTQQYSCEDFKEGLTHDLSSLFLMDWKNANVIQSEEDAEELIHQVIHTFFAAFIDEFPDRSYPRKPATFPDPPMKEVTDHLEYLRSIPQPAQKSKEWHELRHGLMTASNLWKALASESQRNSLIYEKCKPMTEQHAHYMGGSLQWGITYEPITVDIYQRMFNTKVEDFGCIRHEQYPFIGASPDGINVDPASERYGRMIEVKNIVNREITGIPKEEYWIQMQIQMETWNLNECDFVETRFCEYDNEQEYNADIYQEWKGVIWEFQDVNTMVMTTTYQIHPIDEGVKQKPSHALYKTTYWYLDEFSCVYVPRNRKWFGSILPQLETTWNTIVAERETGYEHRASKKRATKKPFCLIKLDGLDETNEISVPISVYETKI